MNVFVVTEFDGEDHHTLSVCATMDIARQFVQDHHITAYNKLKCIDPIWSFEDWVVRYDTLEIEEFIVLDSTPTLNYS